MLKVSASIVAFKNSPMELTAAIGSVLSAAESPICTVVDNSPDPTLRDCALTAGARYVFTGENIGFGGGHNLVLAANLHSFAYHLVLNPDVSFGPEVLPALTAFMDANPSIGLVMPRIVHSDGSEQHLCKLLPMPFDLIRRRFLGPLGIRLFKSRLDKYEMRSFDMGAIREVPCLSGCFMFIRSSVLQEVGLFDTRFFMYMEDVDLCRRIGNRSKTVFYPRVSAVHGYAKGSYFDGKLLKCHAKSAIRYFSKWGWINDSGAKELNRRVKVLEPVVTCPHAFPAEQRSAVVKLDELAAPNL